MIFCRYHMKIYFTIEFLFCMLMIFDKNLVKTF
jgi:hypothetical protein